MTDPTYVPGNHPRDLYIDRFKKKAIIFILHLKIYFVAFFVSVSIFYFVPSVRLSRNIFRYFMVTTSENADFYILTFQLKAETVAWVKCMCLSTRWKYDVICLTFLAFDVIL